MPKWLRGGIWQGYVRVDGVSTKPRTTGCRDEKAADAVLAEWERQLADPAYAASKKGTVDQAADGLLKQYQALVLVGKKSSSTEDYYADKLGTVARVLGPKLPLSKITAPVIDSYITTRRGEKVSEHTIGKELDAIKVMLKGAKRAGSWAGDLDAIMPAFGKMYSPRTRVFSEDEIFALLGILASPDTAAQAAYAIATSAEVACLLNAQRTDISPDLRFVLLRGTKRATRFRTVPIVMPWQKVLLRFALDRAKGEEPYLFKTSRTALLNAMRKACLKLDIPHASPNDLRRTFAVGMREAGFPLELIAPLMGHKDTRMLERVYGRLGPDKIRILLVRLMELNASAVCKEGVVDGFGFGSTREDDPPRLPSHLAPRPGFEPGTYGLTVPSKDSDS